VPWAAARSKWGATNGLRGTDGGGRSARRAPRRGHLSAAEDPPGAAEGRPEPRAFKANGLPVDGSPRGANPREATVHPDDETNTQQSERRRSERIESEGALRIELVTRTLVGELSNHSRGGVLFYSREPIEVDVVLHDEGGTRTRRGRLVRVQKVDAGKSAYAVELDGE